MLLRSRELRNGLRQSGTNCSAHITVFIYAGTHSAGSGQAELISEFEDAASNTYSPGTTPGQAGSDSTSTMLYQHGDHLTTRVTTENSGDSSNKQGHYPYGESWYETGTANPSVLRKFTSYQREDETASGKLNYAVFRQHSARVGRFLMADPVQDDGGAGPQGHNRYAYVASDPINFKDPDGQRMCLSVDESGMCLATGTGSPGSWGTTPQTLPGAGNFSGPGGFDANTPWPGGGLAQRHPQVHAGSMATTCDEPLPRGSEFQCMAARWGAKIGRRCPYIVWCGWLSIGVAYVNLDRIADACKKERSLVTHCPEIHFRDYQVFGKGNILTGDPSRFNAMSPVF